MEVAHHKPLAAPARADSSEEVVTYRSSNDHTLRTFGMSWAVGVSEITSYIRAFLLAPETVFTMEPQREQPSGRPALPLQKEQ